MVLASISDAFERPVVILTCFGVPAAISTAMEAYMFLVDWPHAQRDEAHQAALAACLRAVKGEIAVSRAQRLFKDWAQRRDLLAPDVAAFVASRSGSHGVV